MSIPNDPNAPRIPVHPGGILADVLADRGITAAELADAIGLPVSHLEDVIREESELLPETSLLIARALGTSTGLWAGLQSAYDLDTARAALGAALDGVRVLPGPVVEPEPLPTPVPGMAVTLARTGERETISTVTLGAGDPVIPWYVLLAGKEYGWAPSMFSEVRAADGRVLWRAS
jgi:addiction module HigA family antidote